MSISFDEQRDLQQAIIAYWLTLGIAGEPSPAWKRSIQRLLFGIPLRAPEDILPAAKPMTPYEEEADARETCGVICFHLEWMTRVGKAPPGKLTDLLWARVRKLSERALEIHYWLSLKEEEGRDDLQAA